MAAMPADEEFLTRAVHEAFPNHSIELCGTGGFASTFHVQGEAGDLAVKMLDPEKAGSVRSEREIRALTLVDHPNVVGYRETSEVTIDEVSVRYLVMNFVEGQSLMNSLRAGDLWPVERIIDFARGVTSGLTAIWSMSLAHRDLTPNNIMVRPDGTPVIVDLGIARHLDLETVTQLPTPGSPGWMAPEQVGLEPEHGDWRSDQFTFGLVLYLMSTGVFPFTGDNPEELWLAPAVQDLRPPQIVNPDLPTAFGDVIRQMTAREPYQRYLRPEALSGAIELASIQFESQGAASNARTLVFGLAQGHVKNFGGNPFYAELGADAVIVDARNANWDKTSELLDCAREAQSLRSVDPVNFLDRSPRDARPAGYIELPYGKGDRRTGFSDFDDRMRYAKPIVQYQMDLSSDRVIAPYFYAAVSEPTWIRESLEFGRIAKEIVDEGDTDNEVWTGVAISGTFLREQHRTTLLNLLTGAAPKVLYLLVHTNQSANAPLNDRELLEGFSVVIETMNQAGTEVIVGRRYTEGLLLMALGATGWTVGVSATHQNMQPHPEEADEDARGGKGHDWYYSPELLNSLTVPRRAALQPAHPAFFAPQTTYDEKVFSDVPARAEIGQDTEARVELIRHNLTEMRRQAAELGNVGASQRTRLMRDWVTSAESQYEALGGPWGPAEGPGFLSTWLQVL